MKRRREPSRAAGGAGAGRRPDERPPPRALGGRLDLRGRPAVLVLSLLSAALLLPAFAPFDQWYLAYVALVPLTLAATQGRSGRWAILSAYLAGAAFWAAGLYWLTWITLLGYVLLFAHLGAYWLVAAAVMRAAFRRRWPMALVLPVIWVALEYAREFALSGFPWFHLAHTQHACTRLIQIADATGQYGVSFFVAMVNGALADAAAWLLRRGGEPARAIPRRVVIGPAAALVAAAGLLGYGTWRLGQDATTPGPKVLLVQRAIPISLAGRDATSQEILDQHVRQTEPFRSAGLDLVVWPESMLGFGRMDPAFWRSLTPDSPDFPREFAFLEGEERQLLIEMYLRNFDGLEALLKDLNCPLLAGGSMPSVGPGRDEGLRSNSALLLDLDAGGRIRIAGRYDKMHLVPLSEYVPLRQTWPGFYRFCRGFVPEVMPQLDPGQRPERLEVARASGTFRFAVPICYEGTFARVCRRLAMQDGRKSVDFLVNISNDGWFIRVAPGGVHASTELEQHLVQYKFRAVENRLPVLRAVNTGISGHIDSSGRLVSAVADERGQRKMVSGEVVARVLVDGRVSPYSRVGDVFAQGVSVVAVATLGVLLVRRGAKNGKDRGI